MTQPTIEQLKSQAKALRQALAASGQEISHGQALELVAQQHGARDWNTLHARLTRRNAPPRLDLAPGDRVSGVYLGQAYSGRIIAVSGSPTYREVQIQLDQPIDVVRFSSFSNWRRRLRATIGEDGRSHRKTSDGAPQLTLTKAPS